MVEGFGDRGVRGVEDQCAGQTPLVPQERLMRGAPARTVGVGGSSSNRRRAQINLSPTFCRRHRVMASLSPNEGVLEEVVGWCINTVPEAVEYVPATVRTSQLYPQTANSVFTCVTQSVPEVGLVYRVVGDCAPGVGPATNAAIKNVKTAILLIGDDMMLSVDSGYSSGDRWSP